MFVFISSTQGKPIGVEVNRITGIKFVGATSFLSQAIYKHFLGLDLSLDAELNALKLTGYSFPRRIPKNMLFASLCWWRGRIHGILSDIQCIEATVATFRTLMRLQISP